MRLTRRGWHRQRWFRHQRSRWHRAVFDLLSRRAFGVEDFFETRQGVCRLTPLLARELAESSADWTRPVGRVAEDVARWLAVDADA